MTSASRETGAAITTKASSMNVLKKNGNLVFKRGLSFVTRKEEESDFEETKTEGTTTVEDDFVSDRVDVGTTAEQILQLVKTLSEEQSLPSITHGISLDDGIANRWKEEMANHDEALYQMKLQRDEALHRAGYMAVQLAEAKEEIQLLQDEMQTLRQERDERPVHDDYVAESKDKAIIEELRNTITRLEQEKECYAEALKEANERLR